MDEDITDVASDVAAHASEGGPRDRLLEAAAKLFYKQGYHATGINQLIAEASIARASFYHHFPSKQDLGVAYLRNVHASWIGSLDRHLAQYSTARARLLGLFDFLEDWKAEEGFRGCAFINSVAEMPSSESAMQAVARQHYDAFRRRVRQVAVEFLSGDAAEGEGEALADAIVLLFQGAIVSSQTYEAFWPIKKARAAAERLVATRPT